MKPITNAEFGAYLSAIGQLMADRDMRFSAVNDTLPSAETAAIMNKLGVPTPRDYEILEHCWASCRGVQHPQSSQDSDDVCDTEAHTEESPATPTVAPTHTFAIYDQDNKVWWDTWNTLWVTQRVANCEFDVASEAHAVACELLATHEVSQLSVIPDQTA